MTLRVLKEHGIKGVFFVEPLFAARFGLEKLRIILELILEAGQEVQLSSASGMVRRGRHPFHREGDHQATEPLAVQL